MTDFDIEWIVIDPKIGEVSCADEAQAREYAASVQGEVMVNIWHDGEIIATEAR